jgi:hypothetical protein
MGDAPRHATASEMYPDDFIYLILYICHAEKYNLPEKCGRDLSALFPSALDVGRSLFAFGICFAPNIAESNQIPYIICPAIFGGVLAST